MKRVDWDRTALTPGRYTHVTVKRSDFPGVKTWLKKLGDSVIKGEPIAELNGGGMWGPKVLAPATGYLFNVFDDPANGKTSDELTLALIWLESATSSGTNDASVSPQTVVSPQSAGTTKIFLCYRRADAEDSAGRLHEKLADRYGADRVFIDVDSIPLAEDFRTFVNDSLSNCGAMIVIIGRNWIDATDRNNRRRLDQRNDHVRAEIVGALGLRIPIIPVLVRGATMPEPDDLPEDIRPLAYRNGLELQHGPQWHTDFQRLVKGLDDILARKTQ